MIPAIDTVVILNVTPEIDGGRFPVKRIVGDILAVEADILTHGHDIVRAVVRYRRHGEDSWQESPLQPLENDRWAGSFPLEANTVYEYTIFGWRDKFLSWAQDLAKKHAAGMDLSSDLLEGRQLIDHLLCDASETDRRRWAEIRRTFEGRPNPDERLDHAVELVDDIVVKAQDRSPVEKLVTELKDILHQLGTAARMRTWAGDVVEEVILGPELRALLAKYPDRTACGQYQRILEVVVDRPQAEFGAWYEMWPRSQGTREGRSATFADMEKRLPEIQDLGFDVVYLAPIHPIGRTNRKGPNNSLICPPGSPGCPYAIGNEQGGHTAIEPGLGTLEDFHRFERACRAQGMEVALDLALQTSPDHPWVTEHPEWFCKRPDGSVKFAENPPKKYEDIYPLDFNTTDRTGLWQEIERVIRFWMDQGVRIFRVDNPHTKPVFFWEWLLRRIQATDPDVLFLSEAFTRPKMMKALAKAGFSQSYTYFTWRNFKQEITDYFTELTQTDVAEYMRGNLFTNTPDILPKVLQNAPRQAFKMRAALAATLSSVWGMYNGFELCEGTPVPGTEEYLHSEKYEHKVWDWNRPGNIKDFIRRLNQIRREQPALQQYRNLRFYTADNDNLLFYGKHTADLKNIILMAVNLDPFEAHEATVELPLAELGLKPDETYQMHELISGRYFFWTGARNYIRVDPEYQPAQIFRLGRWSYREQDFDYFI
ncbi:MAG: alpha-1,4-glucan--maltose-1-phosphate maltosyltransferase [Acidobacteria bacterium]|nr:alpha-1,4-glucan--maltose-1-phosphate maltosyltransferase [Acidobacteriota bacterium]